MAHITLNPVPSKQLIFYRNNPGTSWNFSFLTKIPVTRVDQGLQWFHSLSCWLFNSKIQTRLTEVVGIVNDFFLNMEENTMRLRRRRLPIVKSCLSALLSCSFQTTLSSRVCVRWEHTTPAAQCHVKKRNTQLLFPILLSQVREH